MTTEQIRKQVRAAGKRVSVPHLYRIFLKLGIRPSGANQRPQQYPSEAAELIIVHFGLAERGSSRVEKNGAAVSHNSVRRGFPRPARLLSPKQLQKFKPNKRDA